MKALHIKLIMCVNLYAYFKKKEKIQHLKLSKIWKLSAGIVSSTVFHTDKNSKKQILYYGGMKMIFF